MINITSHVYADDRIVQWLSEKQYHPRSDAHGQALCRYFLGDLLYESPLLKKAALKGEIVYFEDYTIGQGALRWTIDLVLELAQQRFCSLRFSQDLLLFCELPFFFPSLSISSSTGADFRARLCETGHASRTACMKPLTAVLML